ncbi:hypothetical protein P4H39_31010 [Paenibacillus lautus]|uniref:hypothetical protein n=1 Tax=Paenibacillus lautus TaxID=1401 RepID=UPI002DBDEFC4|nr:hypothetical protein [Paenibacillus lautus]MEC0207045.1 hypothetical protein [Paenibacillus lautus]
MPKNRPKCGVFGCAVLLVLSTGKLRAAGGTGRGGDGFLFRRKPILYALLLAYTRFRERRD